MRTSKQSYILQDTVPAPEKPQLKRGDKIRHIQATEVVAHMTYYEIGVQTVIMQVLS